MAEHSLIEAMARGVEARRAEMDLEPWRSQAEIDRELMRAALRSILDHGPTPAMVDAGWKTSWDRNDSDVSCTPADIFRAMIAAELEERQ